MSAKLQTNKASPLPASAMKPTYRILLVVILLAYAIFTFLTLQITRKTAIENLHNEGLSIANTQASELRSELQKFLLVPLILSENPDVTQALNTPTSSSTLRLNKKLKSLSEQTGATYIFAVDNSGTTIASSNYQETDSFVGRDYKFRPYFKQAISEGQAEYYAKGETTGRPGLFLAGRVSNKSKPMGAIVLKVEFDGISESLRHHSATSFVVDKNGIILFSGDKSLNFKTITPLSDEQRQEILEAKQFGTSHLESSEIDLTNKPFAQDASGQNVLTDFIGISELDWRLVRINPIKPAVRTANNRAQLTILLVGGTLLTLMLLWRKRIVKEIEKSKMTDLLKTEVAKRTRELSETNEKLEYEIGEREKVNIRFRAAREELAQANRLGSIGTITASVAHELNQPVAAIRTFAENGIKLLKRGDTAQTSTNLDSIVSLTSRIGSISTELRRYARRGSHAITSVDIQDVFEGITLLMGEQLRIDGIELEIIGDLSKLPPVRAGRVRLEQVIVNLLQNASDALKGHATPRVEIHAKSTSQTVEIIIADNGPGIDPSQLKDIFTPFVTTKPDGMGMGLGIAKDIMTDFEGSIETTSTRLGGAAFLLRLKRND